MKILYDSSVLISALLKEVEIHKTGVYRYVENLALGLKNEPGIDLSFYSALAQKDSELWQEKLLNLAHLKHIPSINVHHPIKDQVNQLSKKMKEVSALKKLLLKGYRESLRLLANPTKQEAQTYQGFDIFFSPYHPAPKYLREKKKLITFSTIHDLIPLKFPKFFNVNKKEFFDRILKKTKPWHYFFALSESTKADMCHYYSVPPEKIFIVNSAPPSDLFYPVKDTEQLLSMRKKYKIDGPYILSLATHEPRKNIPFLVDSFIQLLEERPCTDLKLVLAGTQGWGNERLMSKVKRHPKHIILTGFVEDMDLAALYSDALAFVYPSLYEGFGLPPLEAMSCKTPVIVSDRSSLPEVVGSAGLYIDPTNTEDLVSKILEVYENESLRKTLSEKACARAQEFNWKRNTASALKAFQSVL